MVVRLGGGQVSVRFRTAKVSLPRATAKLPAVIEAYFKELQQLLPTAPLQWKNVKRAYTGRPYHNLDHLNEMLSHLQRRDATVINDPAIFALSLVYHDIIYKPTRSDNEARSAASATELLRQANVASSRIDRCHQLIMATKAHLPSPDDDGDEALLIDLDLAVLARDPEDYDKYTTAVRREFWMLPGFVFRRGRTKALTVFLDRGHLYHTDYGREHYEAPARENLWRELRKL